jgi:hypothetical protein
VCLSACVRGKLRFSASPTLLMLQILLLLSLPCALLRSAHGEDLLTEGFHNPRVGHQCRIKTPRHCRILNRHNHTGSDGGSHHCRLLKNGTDVVFKKPQNGLKNREKSFLMLGETSLASHTLARPKSQVTQFFARKACTWQPPVLQPLPCCST